MFSFRSMPAKDVSIMDVVDFQSLLNQVGSEYESLHASHEQLVALVQCCQRCSKVANSSTSEELTMLSPHFGIQAPNPPMLPKEVLLEQAKIEPPTLGFLQQADLESRGTLNSNRTPGEVTADVHLPANGIRKQSVSESTPSGSPCNSKAFDSEGRVRCRRPSLTSRNSNGSDNHMLTHRTVNTARSADSGIVFMSERSGGTPNAVKGERGESLDRQDDRVKRELVAIFNELDRDGTGSLEARELREALVAAGVPQARLQRVFQLADADNSGTIELDEWVGAVMTPGDKEMQRLSECVREKLDRDGGLLAFTDSRNHCMINPLSFGRVTWDFIISLTCCYIAVVLPFSTGWFDLLSRQTVGTLDLIDRVINYFFILDILMNFRTGYVNADGELVMNWKAVSSKYLKTWFLFDVISSLPTDEIPQSELEHLQAIKIMKLSKLVKILRIMRPRNMDLSEISDTLDDLVQSKVVQVISRKSRVFFYMIMLCHWMACGMKIVDGGWLEYYQDVGGDLWSEYLTAIYWAMTTLTTVGYGDITATCDRERAFATVAMSVGACFYGYVVGAITAVVSNSDLNSTAYHERMDLIHAWFNHHRLPIAMKRTLRRYFKAYLMEKSAIDEEAIFQDLSHELQIEVGEYLIHEDVKNNPLFDGIGIGCIVLLQSVLKRVTVQAGYFVAKEGEVGIAMYILVGGCLELVVGQDLDEVDGQQEGPELRKSSTRELYAQSQASCLLQRSCSKSFQRAREVVPGESFGQEILLGFRERHEYTVRALQKSKLEVLQQNEFFKIFQNMPNVLERVRRNALDLNPAWEDGQS